MTCARAAGPVTLVTEADVAKLVDARDLKSLGLCPCGFDPRRPHHLDCSLVSGAFHGHLRLSACGQTDRDEPGRAGRDHGGLSELSAPSAPAHELKIVCSS